MSNPELNIINMADVEAVAVKWLWKPYIRKLSYDVR